MTEVRIRMDVSVLIGTGHFMRCLCLADALQQQGVSVSFASRELPEALISRLERAGYGHVALPSGLRPPGDIHGAWDAPAQEADAADTMATGSPEIVVVDHYGLDAIWERASRAIARHVVAIDDLGREHDCDALIDQNYVEGFAGRYDSKLPSGALRLLGPRFALLRGEFAQARARMADRPRGVESLLVFLGGTDPDNATLRALAALDLIATPFRRVEVVMGSSAPSLGAVEAICRDRGYHLHVDSTRMAELLAGADMAIGAGGTATYERLTLGVPTVALCLADNQRPGLKALHAKGLVRLVKGPQGAADIADEIDQLLADADMRRHMTQSGMALVDGQGAERVAARVGAMRVVMRRATHADSAALHAWRNHQTVRAASRNGNPVSMTEHEAWLKGILASPSRRLLIGEIADQPVGVVRFDAEGSSAEVSIYVVPDRIGSGLGAPLLLAAEAWLAHEVSGIRRLIAETLPSNAASAALFERCDYRRNGQIFEKDIRG